MFHRHRALLVIALLASGAAAIATLRWKTWTPVTACLLCDGLNADDAAAGTTTGTGATVAPGDSIGSSARSSAPAPASGSLSAPAPGPSAPSAGSAAARLGSTPRGWRPWSPNSGAFRVSGSDSSAPSASLGGLWRLMSLSRPGNGGAPAIASNNVVTPAAHVAAPIAGRPAPPPAATTPASAGRAPKPPAPPSASPTPSSGGGGSTPSKPSPSLSAPAPGAGSSSGGGSTPSAPSPSLSAPAPGAGSSSGGGATESTGSGSGGAAPGGSGSGGSGSGGSGGSGGGTGDPAPLLDPFHEHEDPGPDPFGGPSGGSGFDPGGSGAPPSGGGVSATPEPGSILLIGTGLLGILGALRKRRLL